MFFFKWDEFVYIMVCFQNLYMIAKWNEFVYFESMKHSKQLFIFFMKYDAPDNWNKQAETATSLQ